MKTEALNSLMPAAGASLVLGHVIGVPVLGLVFGLAGGIVALTWAKPMKWWKAILSLVASTICGGALGPLFAAIADAALRSMLPGFDAPHVAELVACSLVTGAGFQAVLQALIAAGVNRIRQIGGNSP